MLALAVIAAFAGTGEKGYSGDGGPAAKARLNQPFAVAFDRFGNLHFSDTGNHCIRRVDKDTGRVQTIVGGAKKGFSGDGRPAGDATLNEPYGIAFDSDSNLFI